MLPILRCKSRRSGLWGVYERNNGGCYFSIVRISRRNFIDTMDRFRDWEVLGMVRKGTKKMSADFTKRNYPTMSRVLYDFRQVFGDDVAYTYAKEGANEYGEKWQGESVQPVLETNNRSEHAELGGGKYLGRDFLRVYGERQKPLRGKGRSKV